MAADLQWHHHYCSVCDKQTDGTLYCSEACRLADYDEPSPYFPSSGPGSPSWAPSGMATYPWATGAPPNARSRHLFSLAPAYDFAHAKPYGPTRSSHTTGGNGSSHSGVPPSGLYASSSTSMLFSQHHAPTTATPAAAPATTSVTYRHVLSPSSSQSSLSSMQSGASLSGAMSALSAFANGVAITNGPSMGGQLPHGASAAGASDTSDRIRNELRKYACSLEQGKLQRADRRRRSC